MVKEHEGPLYTTREISKGICRETGITLKRTIRIQFFLHKEGDKQSIQERKEKNTIEHVCDDSKSGWKRVLRVAISYTFFKKDVVCSLGWPLPHSVVEDDVELLVLLSPSSKC